MKRKDIENIRKAEQILKDSEQDAVAAQSESFHEGLAEHTQELIDDLKSAIASGYVTRSKLTKIFKTHGIKFDVLKFYEGNIDY
tara:strand:+ start:186 stop:437 length:252 start_codon:yes stop_codon:yes gene_type:complete